MLIYDEPRLAAILDQAREAHRARLAELSGRQISVLGHEEMDLSLLRFKRKP